MALLQEETLDTVFTLKRRLLSLINESTSVQFLILERFGETMESNISLEELQNTRQRLTNLYSRFNTSLLRIAEYQPIPPRDMRLFISPNDRGRTSNCRCLFCQYPGS